jgi:uncharacterized membrane protein
LFYKCNNMKESGYSTYNGYKQVSHRGAEITYKVKWRRNICRRKNRWKDQFLFEGSERGSIPKFRFHYYYYFFIIIIILIIIIIIITQFNYKLSSHMFCPHIWSSSGNHKQEYNYINKCVRTISQLKINK